ncbi:MAG: cation:dicarboxylase symporter family transporter [Halieaceae bacterium]|jgi:Na+/H+-dicarboxylate symporter|nr:cation:dicarboxylase symporter family transporter [Halieaceae bacterium]
MALSTRIFIGLFAGIAAGLFFGELVADLKVVGDVFVKLLQMTVLPYIVVSLVAGFGRMELQQAKRLALRGAAVLGVIWLLALLLIFAAPLAFPDRDSASFFASPMLASAANPDLLELYLPHNIFYSLSNNLVPAVVLFSIFMGIALISVEDKERVLPIFDSLSDALAHINGMIVKLTPYGIFAIAAAAAGTMTLEELGRVQVYLVTYIAVALLVTFWIFPGLVSAVSGIPFREVLDTFRDALVTAFATGNQFVVLPLIAENCKALLARHSLPEKDTESAIDIIVPVSFNFPSLGKMLVLLFVLFAAWFTDTSLDAGQRLLLGLNGLFSLFGSINVAVPYLLDSLRIPADMFQLFLVTGVVVGRFGAMLAALHIIVLSVIGTLAVCGKLRFDAGRIGRYLGISAAATALMLAVLYGYFSAFVPVPPEREAVLATIEPRVAQVPSRVLLTAPRLPGEQLVDEDAEDSVEEFSMTDMRLGRRFDEILDRGVLRVGYRPNNLPCTFLNGETVVGFDADMAHSLARDLGVDLEFVPFKFDTLYGALREAQIDIAMSCIASLPDRYSRAAFARPVLDLRMALIVPDHLRHDVRDNGRFMRGLRIALISSHYFEPRLREVAPDADFVELESAESFFRGPPPADALLLTAEEGAAYAFRYPAYSVVPSEPPVRVPAAYALPRGETEWQEVVSNWVQLKQADGSVDRLYAYWMEGGVTAQKGRRWSVAQDVLGWWD